MDPLDANNPPLSPTAPTTPADALLPGTAADGRNPELKRTHSRLSMLGLGFAILNSWTALSASLSIALPSGGTSSVLWGLLISGVCNACLAASLAEFLSAYPTAGGQYHWVALLAPHRCRRLLSWSCGWINVAGWLFLVSTGGSLASSLSFSAISFFFPTYRSLPWHVFVFYTIVTLAALGVNVFLTRFLPALTKFAMLWSVTGVVVICITLLSFRANSDQPLTHPSEVFGGFTNTTGYPSALAWALGLLQGSLALIGYDAVAHMVEELPNPTKTAPKVMVESVAIGCISGFTFCTVLLFAATSIPALITDPSGPLLTIFIQATHNKAASTVLLVFPLGCLFFATAGIMATASRMVYAFARDGGLPCSNRLAQIHPTLHTPLPALLLTVAVVECAGLLYFVSTAALNALIAASVLALSVSYAFPVVVHVLTHRRSLPANRPFVIPAGWGLAVNIVGIVFVAMECLLFVLPPKWPWKMEEANWCIVVLGIAVMVAAVDWIVGGRRKKYTVPIWKTEYDQEGLQDESVLPDTSAAVLERPL
ncbi:amino acid permease-domain-containing protein [Geopyxis carbonaria]|nr:amino acid permease-domain-containing protein [Geopyxis carbonaria]